MANDSNHHHLFYQNLTFEFIQSCSCFVFQENQCPPSPRRRLNFQEDEDGDQKKKNSNEYIGSNNNSDNNDVPFLNLVNDNEEKYNDDDGDDYDHSDHWMKDAWKLSTIIQQHSKLLKEYYNLYTNQYILLQSSSNNFADDDDDESNNDLIMSNEETHNFESQLVSFMTSTTKQIEKLRQLNNNNTNNITSSIYHHRNGIITNLFSELKIVMNVYSNMQSIRHRPSLMILDNPYKVCLYPAAVSSVAVGNTSTSSTTSNNSHLGAMGERKSSMDTMENVQMKLEPLPEFHYTQDDDDDEYQFKEEGNEYENKKIKEFLFKYDNENDDSDESLLRILNDTPLPSLPIKMSSEEKKKNGMTTLEERMMSGEEQSNSTPISSSSLPSSEETEDTSNHVKVEEKQQLPLGDKTTIKNPLSSSTFQYDPTTTTINNNNNNNNIQQQLEQETILLKNKIQNESLDSVQKVENQMIQITSLLNQFTSLINDQQVEIEMIHENTMKSKDNVEKGSEQLIQAKESKKRSRHYFALIIVWMGFGLLFLNAIMP